MNHHVAILAVLVVLLAACGQPADSSSFAGAATSPTPTTTPPSNAASTTVTLVPTATYATVTPHPTLDALMGTPIPTTTPVASTYNGQTLPTPQLLGSITYPPPAWLIVGTTIVPASYGTFCYAYSEATPPTCADYVEPERRDDLVTVTLRSDARPVIVIGMRTPMIKEAQVYVKPWQDPPAPSTSTEPPKSTQTIGLEGKPEGDVTVFTLEPLGTVENQLLTLSAQYTGGGYGSASYLWLINPSADGQ